MQIARALFEPAKGLDRPETNPQGAHLLVVDDAPSWPKLGSDERRSAGTPAAPSPLALAVEDGLAATLIEPVATVEYIGAATSIQLVVSGAALNLVVAQIARENVPDVVPDQSCIASSKRLRMLKTLCRPSHPPVDRDDPKSQVNCYRLEAVPEAKEIDSRPTEVGTHAGDRRVVCDRPHAV